MLEMLNPLRLKLGVQLCAICLAVSAVAFSADVLAEDEVPVAPQVGADAQAEPPAEPTLSEAETAALIAQMGSADYQQRQAATEELMKAGLEAQTPLQAALKNSDAEIRRRARLALNRLLALDYERRLTEFRNDKEGKEQHDLEGWERFSQVVGNTPASRELFYAMHREESGLLITGSLGGDLASKTLEVRVQQLQQVLRDRDPKRRNSITPECVSSLLFVASDQEIEFSEITLTQLFPMINSQNFLNELRGGKRKEVCKAVFGAWAARPVSANIAFNNMRLAMQFNVPGAIGPALMMLVDPAQNASHRQYAALLIGMLGDRSHVEVVESLLKDKTVCARQTMVVNGKRNVLTTQLNDVALAVLVHLTGQNHKDYGFSHLRKNSTTLFTTSTLGFEDEMARDEAHARWAQWRKDNPLKVAQVEKPKQKLPGGRFVNPLQIAMQDEEEGVSNFFLSDRTASLQVMELAPLIRDRQFAAVVRMLDELLGADADRSYEPKPGLNLHQSLRFTAARYLAELPEAGIDAYRLFFEAQAQRQLDEALESGRWQDLREIGQRYFHTRPGSEAWLLWCDEQLRQGRWLQAGLGYRRLRNDSPWKSDFEPELSLKLAHCWQQSAQRKDLAREMGAWPASPNLQVLLAGQTRQLPGAQMAPFWISDNVPGPAQTPAPGTEDWPLDGQNPARNASGQVAAPWLHSRWELSNFSDVGLEPGGKLTPAQCQQEFQRVHDLLQDAYFEHGLPALPAGKPLVLGDRVFTRTMNALVALDARTGELLWRSTFRDAMDTLFGDSGETRFSENENIVQAIEDRLYRDRTFAEMSSDGERIYGLEDLGVAAGLPSTRLVVMPDGRRRLDSGWPTDFNRLTAYDAQTGKLVWEVGGPPIDNALRQAGTYFLGAPLPLGGRLYTIAESDGEIRLLVMDAVSGDVLHSELLTLAADDSLLLGYQRQYGILSRLPRRMAGLSPTYAEGVLLCPTGGDTVVALDMETFSPRWAYGQPDSESGEGQNVLLNRFFGGLKRNVYERGKDWAEREVVAAGSYALFGTEAGELLCFDIPSGDLLWRRDRGEALYVAAIITEPITRADIPNAPTATAIVAGPSEILAVNMVSGDVFWRANWTGGGTVTGRGYRQDGVCYFPLSTGEVLGLEIETGQLVQRSLAEQHGQPLGNLVATPSGIFAQNTSRLAGFDPLPTVLELTQAEIAKAGDNVPPELRARLGRLLLSNGMQWEATSELHAAWKQRPNEALADQLRQAVLIGLRRHDQRFVELAAQVEDVFATAADQRELQWALASQAQHQGEIRAAFDIYLKLARSLPSSKPSTDAQPQGAAWVRPAQRVTVQLRQLLDQAQGADKQYFESQIQAWLTATLAADEPETLRRFLAVFPSGDWSQQVRRRLWDTLPANATPLERELALWDILNASDPQPSQLVLSTNPPVGQLGTAQGWAWYELSQLLRKQNRQAEAASCLAPLMGPLAKEICFDDKTGEQLVAALPQNDAVRELALGASRWPRGSVEAKTIKGPRAQGRRYYPAVSKAAGPYTTGAGLLGDLQVLVDPQQQRIVATDVWGREQWNATLPDMAGADKSPINRAMTQLEYEGHLIVARQGTFLFGLDALTGKTLWKRDLLKTFPGETEQRHVGSRPAARIGGLPQLRLYDRGGDPLGDIGPLVSGSIAVQSGRKLEYIDALTGKPQWIRNGIPAGADLYGDRHCIIVQPWDASRTMVLSPEDGRIMHEFEMDGTDLLVTQIGRFVLNWRLGNEQGQLILFDPFKQTKVWEKTFPSTAQFWRCAHDEIAVLDKSGKFGVLGILDGQYRVETQLAAEPDLSHLFVFRSAGHYVVLANRPLKTNVNVMNVNAMGHFASPPLNAIVYGLDRHTGQEQWKTEIDKQGLILDQPSELPVLTFACRVYEPIQNNRRRSYSAIACLDIRTGQILHEEEIPNATAYVQFVASPEKNMLELRTQSSAVEFTFHPEKAQ